MRVRVRVPATTANLGPAFDVLGLALGLYNEIEAEPAERTEVAVAGEGEGTLAADEANLVARAAGRAAQAAGRSGAFRIRCRNRIPMARGLGSSAAAIVGGLAAADAALELCLGRDALLDLAWKMEGHPDNVAAALLGGAVLVDTSGGRVVWTRIIPRWEAAVVAAVPDFAVSTEEARAALPDRVPLRDAVANLGRTARLVAAMTTGDTALLAGALADGLHQPYRARLVPGMEDVISAAQEAGAYGAALSGSGPAIVALAPPDRTDAVGRAMVAAFGRSGHRAEAMTLRVDATGAAATPL
ncbi:MAG TPA: homoserine kinase [bacterium]|nr:homoserine kinase [bacterium]